MVEACEVVERAGVVSEAEIAVLSLCETCIYPHISSPVSYYFKKPQTADRPKLLLIPQEAMRPQTDNNSHLAHPLLPEGNIRLRPLPRHLLCSRDPMCCLHNGEKVRGQGGSRYLVFVRLRVKKGEEKLTIGTTTNVSWGNCIVLRAI